MSASPSSSSASLKISVLLLSSPPAPSPSSSSLSVQVKTYTTTSNVVYSITHWFIPHHSPSLPLSSLLPQNAAGSAAVVYAIDSGDRSAYERLVDADFRLKYSMNDRPRMVLLLKHPDDGEGEGGSGGVARSGSTASIKDSHDRAVMDEEIVRLSLDRGLSLIEHPSSSSPEEPLPSSALEAVFSKTVALLNIGERGLYRDPAYLLGKGVNIGKNLVEDEEFLMSLFTSPS